MSKKGKKKIIVYSDEDTDRRTSDSSSTISLDTTSTSVTTATSLDVKSRRARDFQAKKKKISSLKKKYKDDSSDEEERPRERERRTEYRYTTSAHTTSMAPTQHSSIQCDLPESNYAFTSESAEYFKEKHDPQPHTYTHHHTHVISEPALPTFNYNAHQTAYHAQYAATEPQYSQAASTAPTYHASSHRDVTSSTAFQTSSVQPSFNDNEFIPAEQAMGLTSLSGDISGLSQSVPKRLSLSGSGVSSSKAVSSALRALQQKIKKLEEERDHFKSLYETEKQGSNEFKYNTEKSTAAEKIKFMKEKEDLLAEKAELAREVTQLKEKNKALDNEVNYFKQLSSSNETEKKICFDRTTILEKHTKEYEEKTRTLEQKIRESETLNNNYQNKIDELQRNVLKEKKRREKMEEEKERVDRALKEILAIHSELVEKTTGIQRSTLESTSQNFSQYTNGPSQYQFMHTSRSLPAEPQVTMTPRATSRERGTKTKKTTTKKKTVKQTKTVQRPSSAGKVVRKSSSPSGSIHQRLRKANLGGEVPFLLGKSQNSYNITAAAQKNLHVGTEFNKHRVEEPYNYYATGPMEPTLLDDIDPNKEIEVVIEELKEEYRLLNSKYNELLSNINQGITDTTIMGQLKLIMEQIERKGKQLAYLEKYQVQVNTTLSHAASPPRIRGALKRIKTLKLFHELRSLQQPDDPL